MVQLTWYTSLGKCRPNNAMAQYSSWCTALSAVVVLLTCTASGQIHYDNLYVKWSSDGLAAHQSGEAYFRMPTDEYRAIKLGYVKSLVEDNISIYCLPNDARVCMMYDFKGNTAGILIGLPSEDVHNGSPCNNNKFPNFQCGYMFGSSYYLGRFYFHNPRVQNQQCANDPVVEGLWIQQASGFAQVPLNASALNATGVMTREACLPQMGLHYYYNLNENTSCNNIAAVFLLLNNASQQVSGFGVHVFGRPSSRRRQWFESASTRLLRSMAPTAPRCLENYANQYGVILLHVYFTCNPWDITC